MFLCFFIFYPHVFVFYPHVFVCYTHVFVCYTHYLCDIHMYLCDIHLYLCVIHTYFMCYKYSSSGGPGPGLSVARSHQSAAGGEDSDGILQIA